MYVPNYISTICSKHISVEDLEVSEIRRLKRIIAFQWPLENYFPQKIFTGFLSPYRCRDDIRVSRVFIIFSSSLSSYVYYNFDLTCWFLLIVAENDLVLSPCLATKVTLRNHARAKRERTTGLGEETGRVLERERERDVVCALEMVLCASIESQVTWHITFVLFINFS